MKKIRWICIGVAAALLLAAPLLLIKANRYSLVLSREEDTITLEYGVDKLPEITALCRGSVFNRRGTPVPVTMEGTVELDRLGAYEVTYHASYRGMELSEKRTIAVVDTLPPVITLTADTDFFTSPVENYIEEGYKATDNYDGDLTAQVVREEHDGIVTYTVSDSSGNRTSVERTIVYRDAVAPVISLTGGSSTSINIGTTYADPGFSASDDVDGDLTASVTVSGQVDGFAYGTYTLTYRVSDAAGNVSEAHRTVKVADISAPVITLKGETYAYIKVGTAYSDPGFSAVDNIDGDLTGRVVVSGTVDTGRMGTNILTYTVTDAFGNTASASRSIYVYERQAETKPVNPGSKVVYLTFDDGPGRHTATLLDILDKYGVKATFFVTNQFPNYQHMIGETYRRGHTIALHTYSHVYSSLYRSEADYYADLGKIHDIVVSQTGVTPSLVRFPGGTANTVSRKYCRGIMTTLTQSLPYHGYLYCDWNVSSGDAGGNIGSAAVAANVISGIQQHDVSIVLQHDIHSFSVNAVEQIIFWGLQHGYTFLPMSETTPLVHQNVLN